MKSVNMQNRDVMSQGWKKKKINYVSRFSCTWGFVLLSGKLNGGVCCLNIVNALYEKKKIMKTCFPIVNDLVKSIVLACVPVLKPNPL